MDSGVKKGILLAAFGSGTGEGQRDLQAFGRVAEQAFPSAPVRWAFTSPILRERLLRVRAKSDSASKALEKMAYERFTHVVVQSLHTVPGAEWEALQEVAREMDAAGRFARLELGRPLLTDLHDLARAADALLAHLPSRRRPGEPCIFMGHGSRQRSDAAYERLADILASRDGAIYIGTMEGGRPLEDILAGLPSGPQTGRVWLLPLLAVAGRHVLRDMAGPGPGSWRSRIEAAGHACEPVPSGLAENSAFSAIWLDHLREAFVRL